MGRAAPVWHKDDDEDHNRPTQDTIIKAHINPSSPFISLPNKLFQIVANAWMESFSGSSDDKPFCSIDKCIVLKACSEVKELKDFGLKLGSLNDTLMMEHKTKESLSMKEKWKQQKRHQNETIRKGLDQVEIHKAQPVYMKIPKESYLIDGDKLGFEHDVCYLAITGFIPDETNVAVLGQPFLQNYYVVLDQDNMKIGVGAHTGSDAIISKVKFNPMLAQ